MIHREFEASLAYVRFCPPKSKRASPQYSSESCGTSDVLTQSQGAPLSKERLPVNDGLQQFRFGELETFLP